MFWSGLLLTNQNNLIKINDFQAVQSLILSGLGSFGHPLPGSIAVESFKRKVSESIHLFHSIQLKIISEVTERIH